jgi:hypothetical protein
LTGVGVATLRGDCAGRGREAGVEDVLEAVSESTSLPGPFGRSDRFLNGTGDFEGDFVGARRPPSTPNFREGDETLETATGDECRGGLAFLLPPSIPILLATFLVAFPPRLVAFSESELELLSEALRLRKAGRGLGAGT